MASPVDAARSITEITTATDPWTVNLPSYSSGDLGIGLCRGAGNNGVWPSTPTGWTALITNNGDDATNDPTNIIYRWCDGAEGATLSIDQTGTIKGATIFYRITGALNPATQPPEVSTVAVGTGADPDPPTISPTGGSKDYLFIAFGGMDGETQTFSAAPSSYSNLQQANSGTGGAASTNVRIAGASRQVTGSSEDPGTFTAEAPETGWTAITIAIHPAAAAPQVSFTGVPYRTLRGIGQ